MNLTEQTRPSPLERKCEVRGCSTGVRVIVACEHPVCVEHWQEYADLVESWAAQVRRMGLWLERKNAPAVAKVAG